MSVKIKNLICLLLIFQLIGLDAIAQNSNITISTNPTSGGIWTSATIGSDITYTFTPNINSAILNNTELVYIPIEENHNLPYKYDEYLTNFYIGTPS